METEDFQYAKRRVYRRLFALWKKGTAQRTSTTRRAVAGSATPPDTTTLAVPLPEVLSGTQKHNKIYKIISPFSEQWDLKTYVREGITCRIGRGRGGGMRITFPINAFYFLVSEKAVSHFNVNYSSLLSGQSVACKCTSQVKRGICLGVQTETNHLILIWGWKLVKWNGKDCNHSVAIYLLTPLGHAGLSDSKVAKGGRWWNQRARYFYCCILCPILLAPSLGPDTVAPSDIPHSEKISQFSLKKTTDEYTPLIRCNVIECSSSSNLSTLCNLAILPAPAFVIGMTSIQISYNVILVFYS